MAKENSHGVLIIPGLGDNRLFEIKLLGKITSGWKEYGLTPVIHQIGWKENETDFEPKYKRLLKHIDDLKDEFGKVSIVGTSAGGSAAFNAFLDRKKVIYKAVDICGRLRPGEGYTFRSFENITKPSPAFRQSVLLFSGRENEISSQQREKMMTIRARFGDELVPKETNILEGANNISINSVEHMLSIGLALKPLSKPIIDFLTS